MLILESISKWRDEEVGNFTCKAFKIQVTQVVIKQKLSHHENYSPVTSFL